MSMYKLKSIARRGSIGALVAVFAVAGVPSVALADALNPLTERSLLLSSSAPGYTDTDGSGNSTDSQNSNGENYAPAGTGPNGKKSGQTFTFKVSSTADIKGFTLQYCTTAAGKCRAPGDNTGTTVGGGTRQANEGVGGGWASNTSDLNVTPGFTEGVAGGNFDVKVNDTPSTGWTFATSSLEDPTHSTGINTGKNNYVTLTNGTGGEIPAGAKVDITFRASESVFITNPGSKEFFVKLNTYNSEVLGDLVPGGANNIDGGVTVANVMTDSIHITTKVLETMSFSVGTRNRDNVALNCGATYDLPANDPARIAAIAAGCEANTGAVHGKCDAVQNTNNNRLNLGNPDAEYSLETGKAWDVNSYWRLSSNSSGGATVYYSGDTLRNTVGDHIEEVGETKAASTPGTEQFGLAFGDLTTDTLDGGTFPSGHTVSLTPFNIATDAASAEYNGGATGTIDNGSGGAGTAQFAFQSSSSTVPVAIAQQNNSVISCATAKMRYVGNIGADTPAGVYTTKINYLAAPQY